MSRGSLAACWSLCQPHHDGSALLSANPDGIPLAATHVADSRSACGSVAQTFVAVGVGVRSDVGPLSEESQSAASMALLEQLRTQMASLQEQLAEVAADRQRPATRGARGP